MTWSSVTIYETTSTPYLNSVSSSVFKCTHKDIRTTWDNGRDITLQLLPALMVMFRQERLKWLFDGHILCTAAARRKHRSAWHTVCLGTQDKMIQSDAEAIPDMFQSNIVEHNLPPHCPCACRPSLIVFPGKVALHMFAGWYEVLQIQLQPFVFQMWAYVRSFFFLFF